MADFCNLVPLGDWLTLLPTAWTFSCVWHSAALISPPTWVVVQCSPVLNDTSIIKTWINKNTQEYSCSKVRLDSNDPYKINWKHGVSFKDFFSFWGKWLSVLLFNRKSIIFLLGDIGVWIFDLKFLENLILFQEIQIFVHILGLELRNWIKLSSF